MTKIPSIEWERMCEIKQDWADAVGADPDSLDDWPVLRIVAMELEIAALTRDLDARDTQPRRR